jgi:hypothetical protein
MKLATYSLISKTEKFYLVQDFILIEKSEKQAIFPNTAGSEIIAEFAI